MNEEAKRKFVKFFVLPFGALLGIYYLAAVFYNHYCGLVEPRFWSMVKYAFVTYAGFVDVDFGGGDVCPADGMAEAGNGDYKGSGYGLCGSRG